MTYLPFSEPLGVSEEDPISQHYIFETLVDEDGVTDETYYYYVDMEGYRGAAFQFELICDQGTITCTVEGTLQNDGTAAGSCVYQDITNDVFSAVSIVASATSASDILISPDQQLAGFKYIRVKVVTSTTDDPDTDVTIYHSRWY